MFASLLFLKRLKKSRSQLLRSTALRPWKDIFSEEFRESSKYPVYIRTSDSPCHVISGLQKTVGHFDDLSSTGTIHSI